MTFPLNVQTVPAAKPIIDALAAILPHIETDRLILRAPRLSDWPVLEPVFTTDRAKHIGGPMSAENAWLDYNQITASWILRGFGGLTIVRRSDDAILGLVLLEQEFGDPEPELGWLLIAEAEGQGYATEAAVALREMGLELFGADGFVSYVDVDNVKSIAIANRLGAKRDTRPHPADKSVLVYRHGGVA